MNTKKNLKLFTPEQLSQAKKLPHQTAARWGHESLAAQQLLTRWTESISGTPLAEASASMLESSRVIRFRQDGSPIFLLSDSRTALAYSVALATACLPIAKLDLLSNSQCN